MKPFEPIPAVVGGVPSLNHTLTLNPLEGESKIKMKITIKRNVA